MVSVRKEIMSIHNTQINTFNKRHEEIKQRVQQRHELFEKRKKANEERIKSLNHLRSK